MLPSEHTIVSINLKGTGVRPEVNINPESGLIQFGNILAGETTEKTFDIINVSSFAVNFELQSQVAGVSNKCRKLPFVLIPSKGTIKANSSYAVKIVFQPDHASNHFFDMLLIDIPNQIKPKKVYLRGQAYTRQVFAREFVPFEWRPVEELKKRYEEPLELLNKAAKPKLAIMLEYLRDEEVAAFSSYPFKFEQNRVRKLALGNSRLLDVKMEKNAIYEFVPKKDAGFFECDNLKGVIPGG